MKNIKKIVVGVLSLVSLSSFALGEAELDGYCPVCYIAANKAVQGVEEFKSELDGKTYYFVKEDAKTAFDKSPEKFLPQYEGLCAYGVSLGKSIPADPKLFSVVDGKIYLNSSEETKKAFDADTKKFIQTANSKWAMVAKEAMMKKKEMMKDK